MPPEDLRARLLAECANHVWALRPEAFAVIRNFTAGALTAEEARRQMGVETVEPDAEPPSGSVALIALRGLITPRGSFLDILFGGGGGLQGFRASLAQAVDDTSIDAIVIDVDSPGGYYTMVPEAAADVRAARSAKPVIAISNGLAASAAYFIASQADELICTRSGEVGSIGTYCMHEDWSGLEERIGVKTTLVVSKASPYKTEGNMFEPLGDTARADMQRTVDEITDEFIQAVADGRGTTVDDVAVNFGQGRCVRATAALQAGMVDRVETLEQTLGRVFAGDVIRRDPSSDEPVDDRVPADPGAPIERPARRDAAMRTAAFAGPPRTSAPAAGVTGIAWVTAEVRYGTRTTFGEVFVPGWARDSINSSANPMPMVDMHRQAIGSWSERTDTLERLTLAGPISDTQAGRDVATLLEDDAMNGVSVGFWPGETYLAGPGETVTRDTPYGTWSHTEPTWTLYVIRGDLCEASIVYVPADDARVTNIDRMSADQLGTALPGLRAGAPWDDVAYSMARLMGAPGAGLTSLQPHERQALHDQLRGRYAEHGRTAPVFNAQPDYRATTFHAGEPELYRDRSLGKRCADVVAAIGGSTDRPLSDGTRTLATDARDALNRLLDAETPAEDALDDAAAAAVTDELARLVSSLQS